MNFVKTVLPFLLLNKNIVFFYIFIVFISIFYYIIVFTIEIHNSKLTKKHDELSRIFIHHSSMAKKENIKSNEEKVITESDMEKLLQDKNIIFSSVTFHNDHLLIKLDLAKFSDLLDIIFEISDEDAIDVYSANILPHPTEGHDYITGEIVFFK